MLSTLKKKKVDIMIKWTCQIPKQDIFRFSQKSVKFSFIKEYEKIDRFDSIKSSHNV